MRKILNRIRYARTSVTMFIMVFALLFSCQPEDEAIVNQDENVSEEHLQFLVNSGFHREEIKLKDGIYIIDEDILIEKAEVEAYIALGRETTQGKEQHYRGPYLVSDTYVTNVKFYISSSVNSSWRTAIRDAIKVWNEVNGTKLYMSEVSSSGSAHTVIKTSYSSENWVAQAYLPSSNKAPGHTMIINTKYNYLTSDYKLFTMAHEIGHIVGLYHTNQTQGTFITGTPAVDENSVMNSFILPWDGFTEGDVDAVQILYPE